MTKLQDEEDPDSEDMQLFGDLSDQISDVLDGVRGDLATSVLAFMLVEVLVGTVKSHGEQVLALKDLVITMRTYIEKEAKERTRVKQLH